MSDDDLEREVKNIIWQAGGCEDVAKFEEAHERRKDLPTETRLEDVKQQFAELEQRLLRAIEESGR